MVLLRGVLRVGYRRQVHSIIKSREVKPLANYALGAVVNGDQRLLFLSGQLGMNAKEEIPIDAKEQADICFSNLASVLRAENATLADVVQLRAYVVAREYMSSYMKARDTAFAGLPPPASTLLIVDGFSRPEFLVEVEAVAAIPTVENKKRFYRRSIRPQRRHYSSTQSGPSAEQLEHFAQDIRASGAKVILATQGDNFRRECLRRSRDYYWYSPILKKKLETYSADAVIAASTEEQVVAAARAAAFYKVPLIARGAGTGNYGQLVPVRGGAILDLSGLSGIISIEDGICRALAGTKLSDIEDEAKKYGWELRVHPSTKREATIGGFCAGGSTGHGALLYGGLAEDGAILGMNVVTTENEPRILNLKGTNEVTPVMHAYGTNGIITQVEFPLARAQPWVDAIFAFDTLDDAATFGLEAANAPAIVTRAIGIFEAPISAKYLELPGTTNDSNVVTVQYSPAGLTPNLCRLAEKFGGRLTTSDQPTDPTTTQPRPLYLNGWNHTTLHALKKDKTLTYLQAAYAPERALELVQEVKSQFPSSKLLQHIECVNMGGRVGFAVLAIVWPKDDNELLSIMDWHESHGIPIFNPHDETVEGGGMKGASVTHQLEFKLLVDPQGLLNPGKLRCYDEQS